MTTTALVGAPDPTLLRLIASALESQTGVHDAQCKAVDAFDVLCEDVERSTYNLNVLMKRHQSIMTELEQAALELSELLLEEERTQTINSEIIIDNVIVNIEIHMEVLNRHGNSTRTINAITFKRDGERLDIVSQNSTTLVVYEDKELIMDVAIKSLSGDNAEDTLRLVMVAIERWSLEHRHDNHFDLVITLLLKCKVIVHPVEKVVNPTPTPAITHVAHTRTCVSHNTTFYREGHYRTSRYGVRYWVEGHWVTR